MKINSTLLVALICATTIWADWTKVSTAEALRNTISNEAQIRLTANIILAEYLCLTLEKVYTKVN